ncbi:MAG: hypothetical protein LBL90_06685 [Prevotellaceae bacterium]|jgi:hypothetical protein|nr:hypothetical protein [Prevotellaceae bacterium]
MKKSVFIFIIVSILFSFNCLYAQSEVSVEHSSINGFFRIADKLASGIEPIEEEWNDWFETQGYKICIAETFDERDLFTRKAMDLTLNQAKVGQRDSIMNIPVTDIVSDWESLLIRVILQNFMDIKENRSAITEQFQTINYKQWLADAGNRLKNFLVNPVDSLISPIPVSILCMEPDALIISVIIAWDCKFFYKQTEEERIDMLAHEMFHAYRKHFVDESKAPGFIKLIYLWQNEGIVDLIDKKSASDLSSAFIRYGLPQSYVDSYDDIYQSTPQTIKELEKLTLSFIHNEISEKEFNSKVSGFIQFGGHPNTYYMTTLIKNAGFEKELISTFDSPVEFMKLYNKSIAKEYRLNDEFMNYLEKTKLPTNGAHYKASEVQRNATLRK